MDAQNRYELLSNFLKSRRQGLSPQSINFYNAYLNRASAVVGIDIKGQDIAQFLDSLQCSNGGKHAYYRALRAFYNWLYSPKSGYNLNPQNNPILIVDCPKVGKRILPSVTAEQVETLIGVTDDIRDKAIISLLADSGTRLSELTNIKASDIDWGTYTVTIIGKGNKQRRAPFTERTAKLLQLYLANNHSEGTIWGIGKSGIETILKRLGLKVGFPCNAHSFRRGFACNLHRKGLSTLDIMYLGGWQDLSMVLRYTRSITFEDCLKHYQKIAQM